MQAVPKKISSFVTQMDYMCQKCAGFRFLPSIPEGIREAFVSVMPQQSSAHTMSFIPKQTPLIIYEQKMFMLLCAARTPH